MEKLITRAEKILDTHTFTPIPLSMDSKRKTAEAETAKEKDAKPANTSVFLIITSMSRSLYLTMLIPITMT
jgi:hypothetical protein